MRATRQRGDELVDRGVRFVAGNPFEAVEHDDGGLSGREGWAVEEIALEHRQLVVVRSERVPLDGPREFANPARDRGGLARAGARVDDDDRCDGTLVEELLHPYAGDLVPRCLGHVTPRTANRHCVHHRHARRPGETGRRAPHPPRRSPPRNGLRIVTHRGEVPAGLTTALAGTATGTWDVVSFRQSPESGKARVRRSAVAVAVVQRNLRQAFQLADSYGLLLAMLLIDYVLLMLSSPDAPLRILQSIFVGATAILAFHTSRAGPRLERFAVIAAIVVLLTAVGRLVAGDNQLGGLGAVLLGFLVLVSPPIIMRRVMGHERVGLETILGALCVYLLLGLLFAYTYAAVDGFTGDFVVQTEQPAPSDYVYFSVITLTTTGYGDLSPAPGAPPRLR